MRRKLQLFLLLLLVAATTETGMRASTDCERWMAAYKVQLAHTKAVRRLQAAHARMKRMAQRKLAGYVKKPAVPGPVRAHTVRPKYTRQQMLDRFNLLCGDLPGLVKPNQDLLLAEMTPLEFVPQVTPFVPLELSGPDDTGLIPVANVPAYTSAGTAPSESGPGGFTAPVFFGTAPSGGVIVPPGSTDTPGTTGTTVPTIPVIPVIPVVPVIPVIPIAPVPEPSSLLLMLTGISGAAGVVRRRLGIRG